MKIKKRKYTKPTIYIEEFTISQSIASTCDTKAGFYKSTGCGVDDVIPSNPDEVGGFDESVKFFTLNIGGQCTHEYKWDDNKTCYHIPNDLTSYFGS